MLCYSLCDIFIDTQPGSVFDAVSVDLRVYHTHFHIENKQIPAAAPHCLSAMTTTSTTITIFSDCTATTPTTKRHGAIHGPVRFLLPGHG